MQRSTPRSAAIYCRISHDPSGERLGVRRQEDDCRAEAARRRWQVAGVYVDDDRSAFTSKRPRPEYQRLLRDLQAGTVDGVMIWRLDRLHRQPRELEEFIVVCDKNSVALATVTGDVDLSTSQGRLLARAWGAFAVHESEVRSERLRRVFLERARQGRDAWAVRMYGYEADRLTVNRREAAVVRELARRFLKGESLFSLAIDLNRRKVRSTNGKVWTVTHLRDLLRNPRLAGFSTYHGEAIGRGAWRAIIRPADSERMREIFRDRERQNGAANSPNVLAGLVVCGTCGARMTPTRNSAGMSGPRRYTCCALPGRTSCGHVSVKATFIEDAAFRAALRRLAKPDVLSKPGRASARDQRWHTAQTNLETTQRLVDAMAKDVAAGRMSRREWLITRPEIAVRLEKAKAVLTQDRYDTAVTEFIGRAEVLEEAWGAMPDSRRRMVMRALIDHIVVRPAVAGQRRFNPERLIIRWRGEGPFVRPRRLKAPAKESCAVRGCARTHKSRGLCQMHYVRWYTTGITGSVAPTADHWFHGRTCKADGCECESGPMGWCDRHYRRWLAQNVGKPPCTFDGCERPARARGLCLRHYTKRRYHARREQMRTIEDANPGLRRAKPCNEVGCQARRFEMGFCLAHYNDWLVATADRPRCMYDGCERPRQVRDLCSKHEQRLHYEACRRKGERP